MQTIQTSETKHCSINIDQKGYIIYVTLVIMSLGTINSASMCQINWLHTCNLELSSSDVCEKYSKEVSV